MYNNLFSIEWWIQYEIPQRLSVNKKHEEWDVLLFMNVSKYYVLYTELEYVKSVKLHAKFLFSLFDLIKTLFESGTQKNYFFYFLSTFVVCVHSICQPFHKWWRILVAKSISISCRSLNISCKSIVSFQSHCKVFGHEK